MKQLINLKKALLALCCVTLMLTVPACKDRSRDHGYTKTTTTKKTKKRGKSSGNRTVATTKTAKVTKAPKAKRGKKSKTISTEQVIDQHSANVTVSHAAAEAVVVE